METAASIIAVLQLSDKVIKYIQGVSGATEDRKRLREQVRACSNILLMLRDGAEDPDEGQVWAKTVESLASPLARLQKALELAAAKLQLKSSTKEKLKWPFKEKEVQKLIEAVESEKSLLSLALENNSARLLLEINIRSKENDTRLKELAELLRTQVTRIDGNFDDLKTAISGVQDSNTSLQKGVNVVHDHQKEQEVQEERREVLKWLSLVEHSTQHDDKISRRQTGTCNWFLNSEAYQTWLTANGQTLFCHGIPGAGKTILSAVVIEDLLERYRQDMDTVVIFSFCDFRRQHEQTVIDILSSLLKQLVERQPALSMSIKELYKRCDRGQRRPRHHDITEALRIEFDHFPRAFVLVDALDECEVTTELLSDIFHLQAQCRFNLLATSRPIPGIVNLFNDAQVNEICASVEDVQKYLEGQIHRLPGFVGRDPVLQAEIQRSIISSVEGMFLLAKLHLDSLIGKTSKKAIQNALKKLETGYEAYDSAYTSAMERIGSQVTDQAELAKQVIAWIIHAKRPFTAQELQVALSIEIGEREHDEYNCPDVDDMVSVCAGLVTVDQGSGIIRLVHYTTQEYFDRTRHTWFPDAEVLITTACLSYLSYDNIPPLTTYDVCERWDRQKNSFYIYAVIFWGEHAQSAPSALPHIMDFLRQPKHVRAVGKILFGFCRYTCPSGPRETCTSLHLSAFFGLEAAVSATLKDFVNHDSEKSGDATPLMVAACRGHKTVVKLLLDCTTAKDYANHSTDDGSALHYAVRCGHQTIVELLLKYNARVSARDGSGNTPLYYACSSGSEDSVKLLLDAGAKVNNCKNNCGDTPLHAACEKDNENIVGLLLSAGAKVNNWKNDRGGTPFHAACKNSNEAIVRLLLGVGAEINERNDTYGMTPLYLACNKESEATIKLLLGAGAKVNDRNHGSGGTPLHAAVYRGGEAAIELLLGVGADVNARNNSGSTPLHSNSSRVTEATINSFLAAGADINARNDRGFTPLHIIVCRGSEAAVKLFLAAGADINARNNDGRTPLYVACRSRSTETTIKLLLESGANVNARDNGGSTPLHATIYRGKEAAIKLILGAGADVNARDNGGSTPLYIACRKGEEAVIKLLLGKGANSNARNNEGCTPLHVTISRGMKAAIKLLLDSGANVNAVCCPEGWFPLNIARDECIAEILREYGAQKAPASLQILEAISVSKVERTKMVHVRHSRRSQRFLAITNARVGIQHGIGET